MPEERYYPAPQVEAIAKKLIAAHHPHLKDARIAYLWDCKPSQKHGKAVLGVTKLLSGLAAYFSGVDSDDGAMDAAIIMTQPWWYELKDEQRRALVDHELCHLDYKDADDKEAGYKLVPHDLEEFTKIVQRHGLWYPDVRSMAHAMAKHGDQLALPLDEQPKPLLEGRYVQTSVAQHRDTVDFADIARAAADEFQDMAARTGSTIEFHHNGKTIASFGTPAEEHDEYIGADQRLIYPSNAGELDPNAEAADAAWQGVRDAEVEPQPRKPEPAQGAPAPIPIDRGKRRGRQPGATS